MTLENVIIHRALLLSRSYGSIKWVLLLHQQFQPLSYIMQTKYRNWGKNNALTIFFPLLFWKSLKAFLLPRILELLPSFCLGHCVWYLSWYFFSDAILDLQCYQKPRFWSYTSLSPHLPQGKVISKALQHQKLSCAIWKNRNSFFHQIFL